MLSSVIYLSIFFPIISLVGGNDVVLFWGCLGFGGGFVVSGFVWVFLFLCHSDSLNLGVVLLKYINFFLTKAF